MELSYPSFWRLYDQWYEDLYRGCFLLLMEQKAAEEAVLRTFLRIGTEKEAFPDRQTEERALLRWAVRGCEDFYYRKLRRMPKRAALAGAGLPFPVDDGLWALLQQPFEKKAAFYLIRYLGLSAEDAGKILGTRPGRAARLARVKGPYAANELKKSAGAICLDEEGRERLADLIYLEFDGSNVARKNRLRDLRSAWTRAVPWIALVIVLLFLAAAVYTASLPVPPLE